MKISAELKISVITACYNSEKYIRSTIESVQNQSYTNVEHIIVDGGSSDKTLNIIREYSHLPSIKYISEPDQGIYDALNKGIESSTGDIISILHSDDYYNSSSVLQNVIDIFISNVELEILLGGIKFVHPINESKTVRNYPSQFFKPWMLKIGIMPPHPGAFIHKNVYESTGYYKLGYKIASDFDFFVRLFLVERRAFLATNQYFVKMRTGGVSTMDFNSNRTITKEALRSLSENNIYSNSLMMLFRFPIKFHWSIRDYVKKLFSTRKSI